MQKFLVLYMCPASVIAEWMQKPEGERKEMETKMQAEWQEWGKKNAGAVKETSGAGKTKRVTSGGVTDAKNDLMLYSIVEAESVDAAAKLFEGHPHLGIPEAWIDVMPAKPVPGMQ